MSSISSKVAVLFTLALATPAIAAPPQTAEELRVWFAGQLGDPAPMARDLAMANSRALAARDQVLSIRDRIQALAEKRKQTRPAITAGWAEFKKQLQAASSAQQHWKNATAQKATAQSGSSSASFNTLETARTAYETALAQGAQLTKETGALNTTNAEIDKSVAVVIQAAVEAKSAADEALAIAVKLKTIADEAKEAAANAKIEASKARTASGFSWSGAYAASKTQADKDTAKLNADLISAKEALAEVKASLKNAATVDTTAKAAN